MKAYENRRPLKIKNIYSAFEHEYADGVRFDGEMHNFWEMVCVIKGTAGISADERIYTLKSGEVIFHKPMEFHRIWNEKSEPLVFFVVSFDADGKIMGDFEERICSFDVNEAFFANMYSIYLSYCENEFKSRDERINECVAAWFNDSVKMQVFANAAESFLLSLNTGKKIYGNLETSEQTKLFHLLVKTMRNHIGDNMTVKELALSANTNETNVKRIFVKYTGISPHAYYLNMKIKEAFILLDKNYRISEISEKLGFDNPNYFGIVFKRITGYSPKSYKKLFLK